MISKNNSFLKILHTIIYKFIPLAIGAIGMYPAVRQHLKASEENFRSAGLPVETFHYLIKNLKYLMQFQNSNNDNYITTTHL